LVVCRRSRYVAYPMTLNLAVDGSHVRSISSALTGSARSPVGAVGGTLSLAGAKVALTVKARVTVTLHSAARAQSGRDQPVSTEPFAAVAVSVTVRPYLTEALQSLGQAIPGPRMEPVPLPPSATVTTCAPGGGGAVVV